MFQIFNIKGCKIKNLFMMTVTFIRSLP